MTQLPPFRARRADRLSGGMKQKLALACTLVHEPRVLLLDEPTTGVDPVSRREFWKLLSEFLRAGMTIVMATPYLDEAERCARVALLHDGRLLALDTPARAARQLPGRMVEISSTDHGRAAGRCMAASRASTDVQTFGDRAHVRFASSAAGSSAGYPRLCSRLASGRRLREVAALAGRRLHRAAARRTPAGARKRSHEKRMQRHVMTKSHRGV